MYMKSVFNCLNEMIIEVKSFYTFMNGRSSIGPGELKLAIREFNDDTPLPKCLEMITEAKQKVLSLLSTKCMLPIFKNFREVESFQGQISKQLRQ